MPRLTRRWLLPVLAVAILVPAGVLLSRAWRAPRARPGTDAAQARIPDLPSAQEQGLLGALAAASPGDPSPGRALGDFYAGAGRPFSALWAYSFAVQAQPSDPHTTLGLARALDGALLHDAAIARLRESLARGPGEREALAGLVELHLWTGKPEAALRVLRGTGSTSMATPDGAVLEGRVRWALGDLRGAETAFRQALARDDRDAATWHRLGLLALSDGRRQEAVRAFERARALRPDQPRVLVDLGRALAAGGRPADREAAQQLFREAVRGRPYAPAYYESSLLYAREGRLDAAAEGFSRATVSDRSFADAYRELARVLDALGRKAEAHHQRGLYYSVKDLRAASARAYLAEAQADPSRPSGFLMASQAHFKMTQTGLATELARRAWKRYPGDPQVREQLAALLLTSHNRRPAAELCQEWLRKEPQALPPLWMLGRIAVTERRIEEGLHYYDQAVAKAPENVALLASLGGVLLDLPGPQHLPRAVEVLSRVAALDAGHAEARYQLGVALMRQGRLEEAERVLLRSLDLDPNRGEVYSVVVQLARRLRQPGAVTLFGPIVREVEERLREELLLWRRTWDHPDDPDGYMALAGFLIRNADLVKAESQLEEALRLRPGWPQADQMLSRVRRLMAVGPDDPGAATG